MARDDTTGDTASGDGMTGDSAQGGATHRSGRPVSATAPLTGLVGFIAACLAVWLLRDWTALPYQRALAVMAAVAAPMLLVDLLVFRVHHRASTGLAGTALHPVAPGRLLRKLVGLGVTLGAIAGLYWLFPEYAGDFYQPVWDAVALLAPWLAAVTPVYVLIVDRRQRAPEDAYAQLGALVLAGQRPADWGDIGNHARGWLIKGFFLPLMFVGLTRDISHISGLLMGERPAGFLPLYDLVYGATFLLDLLFTCIGYMLTLRLTDTHIRSAEPTMFGWAVCLVCYQPFWSLISAQYLAYDADSTVWGPYFSAWPAVQAAWGAAILACVGVYVWATIAFGCRFSNLTHRGIITSGPYRWMKHPAYVAKNLSWWLISIPFLGEGPTELAVRQCLLLLMLNGIYALRALTEERHLARDPVYRAYQAWMREHSLVAYGRRLLAG